LDELAITTGSRGGRKRTGVPRQPILIDDDVGGDRVRKPTALPTGNHDGPISNRFQ